MTDSKTPSKTEVKEGPKAEPKVEPKAEVKAEEKPAPKPAVKKAPTKKRAPRKRAPTKSKVTPLAQDESVVGEEVVYVSEKGEKIRGRITEFYRDSGVPFATVLLRSDRHMPVVTGVLLDETGKHPHSCHRA
jgi:hypothetical protein